MLLDAVVIALVLLAPAAWLTLGVCTNLKFPKHNREYLVSVLTMELIRDRTELYEAFRYRRIDNPRVHAACFSIVVGAELLVSIMLWFSVLAMLGVAWGYTDTTLALSSATWAVLGFIAIWAGFLVGGEWFVYWASESSPQYTHFLMLFWGLLTLVLVRL